MTRRCAVEPSIASGAAPIVQGFRIRVHFMRIRIRFQGFERNTEPDLDSGLDSPPPPKKKELGVFFPGKKKKRALWIWTKRRIRIPGREKCGLNADPDPNSCPRPYLSLFSSSCWYVAFCK